jgi:hypothetical protein
MNAQNLQSSVERAGQLELLVEDRDHQICADRDPYLGLHRVGAGSVVVLDSQVPLDPAEEQFDAPAHLVKHGDGECRDFEILGKEDERLACLRIEVFHPPKKHWKRIAGPFESWFPKMVAAQSGQTVHRHRVMPCELKVGLGAGDEERSGPGDQRQSDEVHIATIHQIEGSRLEEQTVEPSHIVLARTGDVDASWNRPTQIDLGMQLDARLGLPEVRPWEEGQGQVDGGGIQCVDRVVEIHSEILAGIERPCLAHQTLGEFLPNPPVAVLVGVRESRFGNRFGKPEMIERFGPGVETSGDVAQALPRGQLRKDHASQLLAKSEMPDGGRCLEPLCYAIESLAVDQVENLGENESAGVHGRNFWKIRSPISNPSHGFFLLIDSFEIPSEKSKSIQPDTRESR